MEHIHDRFQVITGGKHIGHAAVEDTQAKRLTCRVCEFHEGIDTAEFIPVYPAVYTKGNTLHAVTTKLLCLNCHYKGRKTYLT